MGPRWWVGQERFSIRLKPRMMRVAHGWQMVRHFMAAVRYHGAMAKKRQNCPRCGRSLEQSGEVMDAGGQVLAVFQCDECLRRVDFMGERMEVALTFAVDSSGRAFDPADPDADLSADSDAK